VRAAPIVGDKYDRAQTFHQLNSCAVLAGEPTPLSHPLEMLEAFGL
jgi:hypothetical protein